MNCPHIIVFVRQIKILTGFMTAVLMLGLAPGMIQAKTSNIEKKNAWEIYQRARNSYEEMKDGHAEKQRYLRVEKQLIEAIQLFPRDTDELHYEVIEQRLMPGTGRWVEYEDVRIPYNRKYFPNRLLSKIRRLFPPRPWAVVHIVETEERGKDVIVKILNRGSTRMKNIQAVIKNDFQRSSELKTISFLAPGESRQLKWRVRDMGNCRIRFKEKFNYAPCDIGILDQR